VNGWLDRDEREVAVDRAADRLAYLVLSYGLLAIVAYRSFVRGDAAFDLLGLVVLGGLVGAGYRIRKRVASGRWLAVVVLTIGVALLAAVAIVLTRS
jgi:hypothetical protein